MGARVDRKLGLAVKRIFDVSFTAVALVVLTPLMVLIAIVVRLTMGAPVLFRQSRLGYGGRLFVIYKFRTMTDARDDRGELRPDAERLTLLGRYLRRTTLDELPELFNVLRGDMSLVGPRPLLVEYRGLYTPDQWRRHNVRPGMAGPVLAYGRNALSWGEKFALDCWYVDNWSLWLDFKLLTATAFIVLKGKGVSAEGHATVPKFSGGRFPQP